MLTAVTLAISQLGELPSRNAITEHRDSIFTERRQFEIILSAVLVSHFKLDKQDEDVLQTLRLCHVGTMKPRSVWRKTFPVSRRRMLENKPSKCHLQMS